MSLIKDKYDAWKEDIRIQLDTLRAEIEESRAEMEFLNHKARAIETTAHRFQQQYHQEIMNSFMGGDVNAILAAADEKYAEVRRVNNVKINQLQVLIEIAEANAIE